MTGHVLHDNPSFCPICGQDFAVYGGVRTHLRGVHRLGPRAVDEAARVPYREASSALLGIVPEYDDL